MSPPQSGKQSDRCSLCESNRNPVKQWAANMSSKPVKTTPATFKKGKEAKGGAKADRPVDEDLTKGAPGPAREGSNNLRQRAEWFRRRTSGAG